MSPQRPRGHLKVNLNKRDRLLSYVSCLWNTGNCPEACVCVRNITSPPLPAGTLCTWVGPDRPSFRLSLCFFPEALVYSTPSARWHWSHAWPVQLAWTTPCPTYLLLTCTLLSDTCEKTHTHTFGFMQASAGSESLREQAAQPSGRLFTLPRAWKQCRQTACLSLVLIADAVKPSFARLKTRQAL